MRSFLWSMLVGCLLSAFYRVCKLASNGYPAWETPELATVNIIIGMTIASWAFYLLFS